jgi:hypothetical protein
MKMKNKILFIITVCTFLIFVGCEKRIADPQKLDPIYNDLNAELQQATSIKSQLKSSLEDYKKMVTEAKPQTGQRKNYFSKIENISQKLIQIEQVIRGLELSIESREKEIKLRYISSLKNNSEWIDKNENESYFKNKDLKEKLKQKK